MANVCFSGTSPGFDGPKSPWMVSDMDEIDNVHQSSLFCADGLSMRQRSSRPEWEGETLGGAGVVVGHVWELELA